MTKSRKQVYIGMNMRFRTSKRVVEVSFTWRRNKRRMLAMNSCTSSWWKLRSSSYCTRWRHWVTNRYFDHGLGPRSHVLDCSLWSSASTSKNNVETLQGERVHFSTAYSRQYEINAAAWIIHDPLAVVCSSFFHSFLQNFSYGCPRVT